MWRSIESDTQAMDVPGGVLVRSAVVNGVSGSPDCRLDLSAPCFVPGVKLEATLQPGDVHRLVPLVDVEKAIGERLVAMVERVDAIANDMVATAERSAAALGVGPTIAASLRAMHVAIMEAISDV